MPECTTVKVRNEGLEIGDLKSFELAVLIANLQQPLVDLWLLPAVRGCMWVW